MSDLLNIAKILPESEVNGPGKRFVIWVQGCGKDCPGCFNQNFRVQKTARIYRVETLAQRIIAHKDNLDGVTFSGGEPFDQSAALCRLARTLKRNGISVMSYSGYTLDEIRNSPDPSKRDLLGELDMLIDGPYVARRREMREWKGSSNQKVHYLHHKNRGSEIQKEAVEIIIGETGDVSITGNFAAEDLKSVFD